MLNLLSVYCVEPVALEHAALAVVFCIICVVFLVLWINKYIIKIKSKPFNSENKVHIYNTIQYNIFDLRRYNSLQAARQRRRPANMGGTILQASRK